MDDGAPGLEVGFTIDTGGSFSELQRLQAMLNSSEATALKAASQVERSFGGIKLAGATAEVSTFGSAATRELQNLARETNSAERAGERMVAQMEREAATFGKTRGEIRQMNAELRATKADSLGLTELSGRLRAASAEVDRLEKAGLRPLGTGAKLAGHHMQNLAFQGQDLAIQLTAAAQSSEPLKMGLMAVAQQGAQIKGIMAQAGVGIGGVTKAFWLMLLPYAPIVAAVGALTAGFGLLVRHVNQGVTNDQLTRDLGKITGGANATKQELYKLRDEAVTWGDVSKALFSEIGNDIAGQFVSDMKAMGDDVKDVLDDLTSYAKNALAGVYAGLAGTRSYLAEIEKGGVTGLAKIVTGKDPTLLDRTYGQAYRDADKYLTDLGARIQKESVKNARQRLADKIGFNNPAKAKTDKHAEQLAREAAALEAQIRNLYALADAYGVSGAAALIAEARVKAETDAIKKRGDIDAAVDRQIRLSIAQRVSDAAKSAAVTREQAQVQAVVNAEVAAGLVPAERAGDLVRDRIAELPLLAAIEVAQQRGLTAEATRATNALNAQREARQAAIAAGVGATAAASDQAARQRIALLEEENRLIGAGTVARARALAEFQARQQAPGLGFTAGPFLEKYVRDQGEIAAGQVQLQVRTDAYNASLTHQIDLLEILADNAGRAGQAMGDAFGSAGRALGDMSGRFATHIAEQARSKYFREQELVGARQLKDVALRSARERQINALYDARNGQAQLALYGDLASSAKGFFKERSAGFRALTAIERAYRAMQFAMSVQAMVQDAAETLGFVTKSAARATAAGTEGIARQSKLPFPLNIAAMAATGAALLAAGIAVMSGGGGGSTPLASNTGTGTVLGDPEAKSESLTRAIEQLRNIDTLMLTTSRQMAQSLRSIDSQIGGVASVLVRSGNLSANDQVAQGFKPNAIGSVLGSIPLVGGILGGLFGSKTAVLGSGIAGGPQSLDAILAGAGVSAQTYSDVQKTKKFFGVTTSKKTSTVYGGAIDGAVSDQFGLILRSFNDAILAAAGPLGDTTDTIRARLSGFIVNLGKIDLTGLSGTEIQEKLSAIFGAAADSMAATAFPGIERFQKVGEGAFETLVRVASTVETVTGAIEMLGGRVANLGIDAKVALADQFDSVSDLASAAQGYFDAFYTDEERAAARGAQLSKVFGSLNLAMPKTLSGFRQLVDAQDLTTVAGQSAYATLLQLAPAFSDLMGAMGGARTAADAANELRDAWKSASDGLAEEVARIRGLAGVDGAQGFAVLQGRFNAATEAARAGDIEAAKSLPGLSQALLSAAEKNARSRQELDRVRAQTAASLELTQGGIAALASPGAQSIDQILERVTVTQAANTQAAANDVVEQLRDLNTSLSNDLDQLRRDTIAALATVAGNTGKAARVLEDVTSDSAGRGIRLDVEAA